MRNQFKHSLMDNNILRQDLNSIIKFLKKKNIVLTQSKYVRKFEENWSKWLGVKYSVFVNSGSSANILSLAVSSSPIIMYPNFFNFMIVCVIFVTCM